MDAAFDDSGSDDDEDENVPLARSIPGAASATGGRGTAGEGGGGASGAGAGGGTVVWSVDENGEEEQQEQIRQPTPLRTGTGLQDPLSSSGNGGETRAEANLIGMDADERGEGGYDFDRDYVSPTVYFLRFREWT